MGKTLKWRAILVVAVVVTALVFIYPTLRLATLSEDAKASMSESELAELKDKAIKLGYNHPMGPLALADLIGLDIVYHILEAMYDNYKDARYRPPILLRKMVEAGRLGRKSGRGFYEYK